MGKKEDYKTFLERAQNYKNVFDPSSKFMRGRFRNKWFAPFDPYEVNFNYTEANSWQYSFYVPQDITGFINLLGGKNILEEQLDKLFVAENKTSGRDQVDITGLIGQYAHGNEPSHHMAYLYNFVNKPHKTQEKVHQILTELYTNSPDGVSGNEDCGQMSAWYVFSSLGFYPVTPGSNQYIIGSPLFNKGTINLENGKTFTIEAKNNSKENKYIQSVQLNGSNYEYSFINHTDIMNGGNLVFKMINKPTSWGTNDAFIPSTEIKDHIIISAPFIAKGDIAFKGSTEVVLESAQKNVEIFYRVGLTGVFKKYSEPFSIDDFISLSIYSQKGGQKSAVITTDFYKIDPNIKIKLQTSYANQYNAGGDNALIDGILGTKDFRTGTWQGYWNEDVIATVDLGKTSVENGSVEVNFLEDQKSWIFLPSELECLVSTDGVKYNSIGNYSINNTQQNDIIKTKDYTFNYSSSLKVRYVKLIAKKLGELPTWHLGYPHDGRSWLFIDEIQIK